MVQVNIPNLSDGLSNNQTEPYPYIHSASAADLTGSGYADVVVADHQSLAVNQPAIFVLKNPRDGSTNFTADRSPMHQQLMPVSLANLQAVWALELIDFDNSGHLELWAAGQDAPSGTVTPTSFGEGLQSSTWPLTPDSSNRMTFASTPHYTFPSDGTFSTPLDVVVKNGSAYFDRVPSDYSTSTVQKVTYLNTSMIATDISTHTGSYSGANCPFATATWIDWIRINAGMIITDDSCRSPNVTVQ